MSSFVVILGATSAIASKAAALFAEQGHGLYLAGRNAMELSHLASDLTIRYGVPVHSALFEAKNFSDHLAFFNNALATCGKIDGVLWAIGTLSDTGANIINVNLTGAVSILNYFADYLAEQRRGFIIGISSVAGDRGRKSNYIYGAAKSGLTTYLQGLRQRLYPCNVKVIAIKPGFVDTRMTFGKPKVWLPASPEYVAQHIVKCINKSGGVFYIPWFWRYIMLLIKLIPDFIFKRLDL